MENLSIAMQNYLETIFDMSRKSNSRDQDPQTTLREGVRVRDLAARLDVSKASVNNAMNVLAKLGFVFNETYPEIYMTDLGKETAALLEGKHKIIKALFTNII